VWFGKAIEPDVITRSVRATACAAFFTIGTSALMHPAAGLIQAAGRHGAFTVEINLEPTPASEMVDVAPSGPAEEILACLDELLSV
jgi:NAD-dependent deacetylase